MGEILWKATRPSDKALRQPEGPVSYYLDAYGANDLKLARQIWSQYGGAISRVREIDRRNWKSSWNWWPGALGASLLAAADQGDMARQRLLVEKLACYCQRQLNRVSPHCDLWGNETLSRIYNWPMCVMALVHEWASRNRDIAEPALASLEDLLRAHAYLLTLFGLPQPHPESLTKKLYVCAPGMRSHKFQRGQKISFVLACMLDVDGVRGDQRAFDVAAKPGVSVLWSSRVAWKVPHEYLGEEEREMLRQHVRTGKKAVEIVEVLNDLGVELRAPIQVWRYQNGDFVTLARRNVQGSTPPIMAMSRVDGTYHHLSVHRKNMRGEGGRRLGSPSLCWRDAGRVHVKFPGAIQSKNAAPEDLEGSIPAPPEDEEILFAARIGRKGKDDSPGVWVMTEETREEHEEGRRSAILKHAEKAAALAEGQSEESGIYKHAQVLGVLASAEEPELEKIYRRSRAIERLAPMDPQQEMILRRARRIVAHYEWWA